MSSESMPENPEKNPAADTGGGAPKAEGLARRLARPLTERAERRRRKISEDAVAAAKAIAKEEGLKGLTARRIARAIGCSVGTLYNVFDNLDTLILHVNSATFDALYEKLLALELPADANDAVRRLVEAYLAFVHDNANLWAMIFDHAWPKEYPIPEWYLDKTRRLLALLAKALAPLFPPERKEASLQAAVVLWSGLHGVYALASTGKLGIITSETVNALTDEMIATVIAGLKGRYGLA